MTPVEHDLRAYRFALDLTTAQATAARQHAGAARWAYNHSLAAKFAALDARQTAINAAVGAGIDLRLARSSAPKIPTKATIQKALNATKGDDRTDTPGLCPWWHTVSTYAFQSAFQDADNAWANWVSSITSNRAGPRVGRPRLKKKNRSRDSFRIHHDVNRPTIRPDQSNYRRIIVPRLGSLRVHNSTKRLRRALKRGSLIQSVTISRGGHRWYASILVKTPAQSIPAPTRRQQAAGRVGVDLGVNHLAALSTGELIANPRHLRHARHALVKAHRRLSRTQKGSNRRRRAAAALGRRHHQLAERRATTLHGITKRLATEWAEVAIEDLNVTGMTRSARGSLDTPGRNVAAKAGLNRSILDAAPGEFRRQLTYKTQWYGSILAVCDRWFPSTQTCSACQAKATLRLADRVFHCMACGFGPTNRDLNAALNIAAHAVNVTPGRGGTQNARRVEVDSPPHVETKSTSAMKREDLAEVTSAEQSTDHPKPKPTDQRTLPLVS